jgi:predicted MFS family arabinose efflux permease
MFSPRQFAFYAGITNMMGTIGAMCGGVPVAKLVNAFGWRKTIFALAAVGIVIAMLVMVIVPKSMRGDGDRLRDRHAAQSNWHSLLVSLKRILRNKQVILSGLVGGSMYLPVSVFSELWAIPFFMTKYNIDNEIASWATLILFVGFALESIPVVMVVRKLNGYVKTISFSIFCVAPLFVALVYIHTICTCHLRWCS